MGKKVNWTMAIFAICAILITAFVGIGTFGSKQTANDDNRTIALANAGCDQTVSVNVIAHDAENPDTTVTVGSAYIVNGKYRGYSYANPAIGDKVKILVNASSYIDTIVPEFEVKCGPNNKDIDVYATTAPTISILDENSNTLTDNAAGGAQNLSAIGAGKGKSVSVKLEGTSKKSTSQMTYVVELGSIQNVSDVTMTLGTTAMAKADKPSFYSDTLTSPYVKAFVIPATVGVDNTYTLKMTSKEDKTLSGAVYTTLYGSQAAVDKDGSFLENAIENSNGDVKYEWTADSDFFINAA